MYSGSSVIPSNPPSPPATTPGTVVTRVRSPPSAGMRQSLPVIRSPTSTSPSGRNASPHGTSRSVAISSASPPCSTPPPQAASTPATRQPAATSPASPTRLTWTVSPLAASGEAVEELQGAAGEQGGGLRVVRRQRAVGEQVLVAGVGEELRELGTDLRDELAGRVDVALLG